MTETLSTEVKEFPFLTIYNDGKIYNTRTNKYLNLVKDRYLKYMIWDGKKEFNRTAHRLMAIAFIPNPNNCLTQCLLNRTQLVRMKLLRANT